MAIIETIEISTGKGESRQLLETIDYTRPGTEDRNVPDLEEAIEMDGELKVWKLYLNERKTSFMDTRRRFLLNKSIPPELKAKLKDATPEQMAQIEAILAAS